MLQGVNTLMDELLSKVEKLGGESKRFTFILLNNCEKKYSSWEQIKEITTILDKHASQEDVRYYDPLVKLTDQLLGEYYGDVFRYIVTHANDYPYSEGYYRRPFRTANRACYTDTILHKLISLYEIYSNNFSLSDYLTLADYRVDSSVVSDILAFEIDRGNDDVIRELKRIIYGDNNTALLSTTMIKGMFLSHSQEAYDIMGQLLLAARLQEGLRQSIVERMDEGTIEASIYMLRIIIDNDLIRYSSVVRALAVWTGIPFESIHTRIVKQCIQYAYDCLNDEGIREQWLHSNDVNQLYMSLWATSVVEENNVIEKIHHLMQNGELYQKIVAQYFLSQSQNDELKYQLSQQYLEESDFELQYWIVENYSFSYSHSWDKNDERTLWIYRLATLENKEERNRQFDLFRKMLRDLPKKEMSFPSKVYDWLTITFSTDMIARKMMYLAAYDYDHEWIAEVINLKDLVSPHIRDELLKYFIRDYDNPIQRGFILASLSDKSVRIRETAITKMKKINVTVAEIRALEEILSLKNGSLRQHAIKLLLTVTSDELELSVGRLLQSKNEFQRVSALEIITELKEHEERTEQFERLKSMLDEVELSTEKEKVLLTKLFQKVEFSLKEGLGLFHPQKTFSLQTSKLYDDTFQIQKIYTLSIDQMREFLNGLADLVHIHREYEYEVEGLDDNFVFGRITYLLGADLKELDRKEPDSKVKKIEYYPLSEVWSGYLEQSGFGAAELLQISLYLLGDYQINYFRNSYKNLGIEQGSHLEKWIGNLLAEVYPFTLSDEKHGWSSAYFSQVKTIVHAFFEDASRVELFTIVNQVLFAIINRIPIDECRGKKELLQLITEPWLDWEKEFHYDDQSFQQYFTSKYILSDLSTDYPFSPLFEEMSRAYSLNIINANEYYKELAIREYCTYHLRQITRPNNNLINQFPQIIPLRDQLVERVVQIELNRGELPTEVTHLAMSIQYIEGMDYFIKILTGLDQESFVRGYIYGYGKNITKKEAFSHLLRVCHPKSGEDEVHLRQKLEGKNISEIRLLEAAMYAPQWLDIIDRYLQWEGLRSAAWYFHAHCNESFSAEKETIIAHYSPISPEDLHHGAFDIQWFKEAYSQLGEKRFSVLYKCARYISGGSNHRRSQLFADATLGNLKLEDMKQSVITKRNKDHLLCYSLIPIAKENEKDVLERYECIQQFLNESKKFGAQRRASEAHTANLALENLARNAGYKDVTRLKWDMEAKKLDDILPYLEPHTIDELTVQLVIDADGHATIKVKKNNKEIKSIPAKYNKHEYIIVLKEIKAELKDQYSRAKMELERSMEMKTTCTLQEVINLLHNPVIAPLLSTLVFKVDSHFGYFADGSLVDVGGDRYQVLAEDEMVIAHPVDLFESGRWSEYQRDLFSRQIKQPFKQVFRELYIPNDDELASRTLSRRYAGHQVQPRKTVALLKNRSWTVSYEEGLQKVYHQENIIARIHALADWFSPSDVECPTIETVSFFDRHTYQSLELNTIPKHIFSEVMRDVDLVVSVAHVGGVDPEASLSTIEMRKAIVSESLRLMKVNNVRLQGNFALIAGNLGQYGVHLGSGMVSKQATGSLYIIPVHAQHRGRIFLPFMDEDPKTAEILSKIVMLAQDNKIKDPYILSQLRA